MKKNLSLHAGLFTLLIVSAMTSKAQLLKSRRLNTGGATTIATQPIPADTVAVNKTAASNGLIGQRSAAYSNKTVQPGKASNRDQNTSTYGGKYNSSGARTQANSAVSGVYMRTLRSGGVPITIKYKINNPNNAATNIYSSSIAESGKTGYMTRNVNHSSEEKWNCTSEQIRVSIQDDSYMKINYESQADYIWPGAIYSFDNFISSRGDETDNRNPIIVSTSNPNTSGSVTEKIQEPDVNNARQAIANLYGRFTRRPEDIAVSSMQIHTEEVRSAAELDLKVGASGYGGGFSASNRFAFSKKNDSHIFLFDCTKEMFSIDTRKPKEGFFTDPSRETEDMMYISSVTYGQRVMALIEISLDNENITNNFQASYNGLLAGGSGSIDIASNISNGKAIVNMFVVGGQSEKSYPAFTINEMKTRLQEIIRSLTYTTAKPIRYTLRNMNNDVVKYSSITDYFNNISCEPKSESEKPATFLTQVQFIRIDNLSENDVDLYGTITAEVVDASGNKFAPQNGNPYLMNLNNNEPIRKEELARFDNNLPVNSVSIYVNEGHVPGAKLLIHYCLNDKDDSPGGDDPLKMRGKNPDYQINGNRYYVQVINLDDLKKGSTIQGNAQFVDDDGDYPFTVTISVSKQ